jgi:integrase
MKVSKRVKGRVNVQSNSGRLRLTLPREWFGGEQKRFTLGLSDARENWILAEQISKQVELDYLNGCFDSTLQKYKVSKVETPIVIHKPLTLGELWERYQKYKQVSRKETSQILIEWYGRQIAKIGHLDCLDALVVREQLQSITTNHQTKRILIELNAAVKWAIKHKLIVDTHLSPYAGMAAELPAFNYQLSPKPNAFSEEEMQSVIQAFEQHRGNWNGKIHTGHRYSYYTPLVKTLFLTGARTSEVIGLKWGNVSPDCDEIEFNGSLIYSHNRWIQTAGSKNNRTRVFPCSPKLQALLVSIKPASVNPGLLIFPGKRSGPINRSNFAKTAWTRLVDPIKPGTTPYSCRDTFITTQLLRGISAFVIAKWTDTSVEMIERVYADVLKLRSIKPLD